MKVLSSIATLALAAAAPLAAQQAVVTNAGSERALRIGDTTVSRPFGGLLVDDISVVGRFALGGVPVWLVRGDGDAACPNHYVVVARRSAEDIVASEPFGNCGVAGPARVSGGELVVPFAAVPDGPAARFGYRAGRVRLLTPAGAVAPMVVAAPMPGIAPGCRTASEVNPDEQALVIEDFRRSFPREYRSFSGLKRSEFAPAELRTLVTGLACLATWPAAQDVVPREATKLFASKRWGRAAFAALDAVARDPATDVNMMAAVKSFSSEMNYRVDRRSLDMI